MKKIRLRTSITLDTVLLYIGLFCVTTYAFLEPVSATIYVFWAIKIPLLIAAAVCLVPQIGLLFRVLRRKNYFYAMLSVVVLCLLLAWSMLMNRDASIGISPLRRTFRMVMYMAELFLYMIIMAETGRGKQVVNYLFWYMLLMAVMNDVLMFSGVIRFRDGRFETYLMGTKFSVAYLHMNLLTMWFVRQKQRLRRVRFAKLKVLLAAVYIIAVCIRVDVVSGMLGCLVLVFLFFYADKPKGRKLLKLASPNVLVLTIVVSIVFAFVANWLVGIPAIRFVVEDVLKRDATITGRLNIYEDFTANMQGHWMAGYGLGNGNDVTERLFGYENVQNGVLDWVLQVGVFATGALLSVMVVVFRQLSRRRGKLLISLMPLVCLVYMYIILGMIETTLNMCFFLWLALIFLLANERHPELQQPVPQALTDN